jgi:hypothetical protein
VFVFSPFALRIQPRRSLSAIERVGGGGLEVHGGMFGGR